MIKWAIVVARDERNQIAAVAVVNKKILVTAAIGREKLINFFKITLLCLKDRNLMGYK